VAEHRPVVEALRDALLERDELIGEEILDTIRSVGEVVDEPRLTIVGVSEAQANTGDVADGPLPAPADLGERSSSTGGSA